MSALDEHLAAEFDAPEDDEARERFIVDSKDRADWALRKLARIEQQERDAAEEAERQFELIREWWDAERARLERDKGFFTSLLTGYHRRLLEEDPRQKSVSFPHGKLLSRKQPARWDVDNHEACISWLEEHHPDLLRVKKEPNKPEMKKVLYAKTDETGFGHAVDDTGEIVPGLVVVQPSEPAFSVEVS